MCGNWASGTLLLGLEGEEALSVNPSTESTHQSINGFDTRCCRVPSHPARALFAMSAHSGTNLIDIEAGRSSDMLAATQRNEQVVASANIEAHIGGSQFVAVDELSPDQLRVTELEAELARLKQRRSLRSANWVGATLRQATSTVGVRHPPPMSAPADVAPSRHWHVSEWLVDGQPARRSVAVAAVRQERVVADPGSSVERAELPPLWKRIVTGRSVGWRIRRFRRGVRNFLRRAVSRLLRWFQRNPDVVRSLENGRLVEAIRVTRRSFSSPTVVKGLDRAEAIEIRADLEGVGSGHPLLRPVRLVPDTIGGDGTIRIRPTFDGAEEPTVVLGRDRSIAVHRGADRFALLAPLDIKRWNPIAFPQRATTGPVGLGEIVRDGHPAGVHRRLGAGPPC